MKKTKMLIATLVCAVMLMGVGYAWWSDSITLGVNIDTGYMNVIWENAGLMPVYGTSPYAWGTLDVENEKELKFSFHNLYPGATAFVDAVAKNDSTIPVRLKDVILTVDGDEDLLDSIYAYGYYYRTNANGQMIPGSFGYLPYDELADLDENLEAAFQDVVLNPGDMIFFGVPEGEDVELIDIDGDGEPEECIIFYVDHNAGNEIEEQEASITLQFDWKQFNEIQSAE